jgi:hypothetical protein
MMFDNAPAPAATIRRSARQHAPMALLIVGAGGVAASVHLASPAVALVAVGLLAAAGLLVLGRRVRPRPDDEGRG